LAGDSQTQALFKSPSLHHCTYCFSRSVTLPKRPSGSSYNDCAGVSIITELKGVSAVDMTITILFAAFTGLLCKATCTDSSGRIMLVGSSSDHEAGETGGGLGFSFLGVRLLSSLFESYS
jgi:hypothetical protein